MKKERLLTMATGKRVSYLCDQIGPTTSYFIVEKKECVECDYCAPNIPENNIILGFQPRDVGACFYNYPTKISVINLNFRTEINCRKFKK